MKFYLKSGEYEIVLAAEDWQSAARQFVEQVAAQKVLHELGVLLSVSEAGFSIDSGNGHENDHFLRTADFVRSLGLQPV